MKLPARLAAARQDSGGGHSAVGGEAPGGRTEFRPLRHRKLPAGARAILFPMILSLLMSGIVSAIATARTIGIGSDFLGLVAGAWIVSYAIAFPTALLVIPVVRRIVALLVEPD